uniref:Uncharacterized protein n=1 Tax=Amphora coffeiformis TaxID=265554 RepID=A0A7S3PE86_9STRA|mmetsp:Transcript_20371/g.38590  ORF Transcript_20371/g.38590 Transcript_20371/m.38590 type:complete len:127 (-) Transcript_20371:269-649(-)
MSQSGRPDELSLPGGQTRNVHEDGRRRTRTLCHEATEQEDDVLNCRVLVIPLHDAIETKKRHMGISSRACSLVRMYRLCRIRGSQEQRHKVRSRRGFQSLSTWYKLGSWSKKSHSGSHRDRGRTDL